MDDVRVEEICKMFNIDFNRSSSMISELMIELERAYILGELEIEDVMEVIVFVTSKASKTKL